MKPLWSIGNNAQFQATIGAFENKKKKKSFDGDVELGSLYQNESSKLRQQEEKNLRQLEK